MANTKKHLEDIFDAPFLKKPYIHMKSPEKVLQKINGIIIGDRNKLQVIFDFDRTLTKHCENGVLTKSSFGILEDLPQIPDRYKQEMKDNLAKYLPIETDPNLSVEEKIPYMLEWWISGIEILKGVEWDPVEINKHIKQNRQPYRENTKECLQMLYDADVPVLVFSAGIGNVVKSLLELEGFLSSNVHVVSNFLKIEDGKIAGCLGDIIHVFNKNEQLIEGTPYFESLSGRTNVILLGDSIGDAKMADGVPHDTVLKIGFLNNHIEESMGQYMEMFDIVLAGDESMNVLCHILRLTLCQ